MSYQNNTVTIKNHTFTVEIARTDEEMGHGLEKRVSMPISHGMLFIFSKPEKDLNFYMEDVYFPLDMIFIQGDAIVSLHKNVPPLPKNAKRIYYNPTAPSDKVLEINAGLCDKYDIQEGDKVVVVDD